MGFRTLSLGVGWAVWAAASMWGCGGSDASELFTSISVGSGGASGAGSTTGGGAGASAGQGGSSGGPVTSGTGGASGTAGSPGSGGAPRDAGPSKDAVASDARSDRFGSNAGDAGCPDVFGTYVITDDQGSCGNFNKDAPQSILGTNQTCFLHFSSVVFGGVGAVNGGATLDPDGTFSGATLNEGTATRTPCNGTWNAGQQTMTIACGGTLGTCTVVLTRIGR
jgi:hypothetical protein